MKVKQKYLFVSLLFVFAALFIPNVNAIGMEFTSAYYSIYQKGIEFVAPDVTYSNLSFSYYSVDIETNNIVGSLNAVLENNTDQKLTMDHIIYYYNKDKLLIGQSKKTESPPAKGSSSGTYMLNVILYDTDLKYGYSVNDIVYFKLFYSTVSNVNSKNTNYENQGTNVTSYRNGINGYLINGYNINLDVHENNVIDITENIDAYFTSSKHGIFRKIPLKNKVERLDGTVSYNRVKISDISINEPSTMYSENGYKVIKIGDPDVTLTGPKKYNIEYSYNLGKDTGKNYDELYFNLIGTEWDTTIDNVSFTIKMPKEFDSSKLGFSAGSKYSTYSNDVSYSVLGNTIKGTYNKKLNPGEAVTVRIELPEGYFVNASNNFDFMMLLNLFLPILFVAISIFFWNKYGKDNMVIETVEFYPPEGYNSAEIGFLYKGISNSKDVVSLIVYLANKGYLKIVETEEQILFMKSKSFKLVWLKAYDGDNDVERTFFEGLFKSKTEVTSSDLTNKFYRTLNEITGYLNDKENKYKVFDKKSFSKNFIIILMIMATFFLITVKPVFEFSGFEVLVPALIFPGIGFSVLFAGIFGKLPGMPKLFALVWGLAFGGMPWISTVLPALQSDNIYAITYIVGLVCVCIMCVILTYMPRRTVYGNEMLGKIRGFKNFLKVAEKDKLEELVMEDPSYFYNILPYTYVLGVSDKWIKKFETIITAPPDWYSGSGAFSYTSFSTFMTSTMSSATSSMSSSPSSSGGGSSGGGSSGGGSGGGGGGSW